MNWVGNNLFDRNSSVMDHLARKKDEKRYFSDFGLWIHEDFIPAIKKLNPTQTEIFAFKAIITMDPSALFL